MDVEPSVTFQKRCITSLRRRGARQNRKAEIECASYTVFYSLTTLLIHLPRFRRVQE